MLVRVVFENCNEWSEKWDIMVGLEGEVNVDLGASHTLLISNDNWNTYQVDKYRIYEFDIPQWLYDGWLKYGKNDQVDNLESWAKERSIETLRNKLSHYVNKEISKAIQKLTKCRDTIFNNFIKQFWSDNGFITLRQANCVNGGFRR